jgi:iron complex outermembrane receptor protein
MPRARFSRPLSGVALLALAWSGAVGAQTVAPKRAADATPATDNSALADIVVTAERRQQSLQSVPIAATVLNATELDRRGVTSLSQIQQVAPSVAINTYNRSTYINIRGVGIAQSAPTSNPGVAYYLDGVLIPHEQFIGQSFYDIGSIEVLRGPQGTLTGQNSTGGAVYVRSPDPEFGSYSGYVDGTTESYSHYRGAAALNLGFSDEAAVRVAAVHDQRDSFTKNIGGTSQPGNSNLDSARINIALRSADQKLKINLRGEWFDLKTDNNAIKNRTDAVTSDPFTIEEDGHGYLNQHGYRVAGEARYDLTESVQARGLVSWQDGYTHDQTDGDRTATAAPRLPTTNVGRLSQSSTTFRTLISEVNLLSTNKGPFQWVIGGFLLREDIPVSLLTDNFHTVDFTAANSDIETDAKNRTESFFGQANYFVTSRLELIAGGRYSWDKQIYTRYLVPGAGFTLPYISEESSHQVTGKVGLNYHLGRNLIYVTASKGYKAGGVNLTPVTPNFVPERNFVYEAGVKTEMLDRHLRLNGDVYYSNYKDIQLSSLVGGLPVTQNALSGHSYGAELEATGQFGGFSISAGGGYLHARFAKSGCISDTNSPGTDTGCTTNLRFVPSGRDLPFSPEWTINGGVQYAFALGGKTMLTPRFQVSYLSSQYATPFPSSATYVPGRTIADLRLTLDLGERYKIEGFVTNLFDKTYIASQVQSSSSATGGILYGAPRTYGVRAVVKFGN